MRHPLDVSPIGLGNRIARVHEKSKNIGFRHQVVQQFQLLCHERVAKRAHSRDVPTGPIEAGDKAKFDGITAGEKDNRNGCGRSLGRESRAASIPKIIVNCWQIESAANAGQLSIRFSAQRYSIATFSPST